MISTIINSSFLYSRIYSSASGSGINQYNKKIADAHILFLKDEGALALPNLTKIDTIVSPDEEVVVQDYSSQRVSEFLKPVKENYNRLVTIWDCCAATAVNQYSQDYLTNVDLTVSDIRQSILVNLQSRFRNRYKQV